MGISCPFAAARAYRDRMECPRSGSLRPGPSYLIRCQGSVCPPSFAITYLSGPIAFWEEVLGDTLRAPIGESYLQHSCKHFKSWSAYHPGLVPTGSVDVPSIQPACALGCGTHKSRIPTVIAWAAIKALGRQAGVAKCPDCRRQRTGSR